jgi:hypothetical protein
MIASLRQALQGNAARPKGQPKSDAMGDDELELEALACINAVASPWDILATHHCSRNFVQQQQRI